MNAPSTLSALPVDPEQYVDQLLAKAESWLHHLRTTHRPAAQVLGADEREHFCEYFSDEVLQAVRVAPVSRIENPEFFKLLPAADLPEPWDYSAHPALTAIDTILLIESRIPKGRRLSLLFKECVHVQQFLILGPYRMAAKYLHGLIVNGFDYRTLPLERQGDDLQLRFDAGYRPFSVKDEIERALQRKLI
jgi:hypothetical protein